MKTLHKHTLIGHTAMDEPATPQEIGKVMVFRFAEKRAKGNLAVFNNGDGTIRLETEKGSYTLKKHETLNYYCGICGGYKVQVTVKKLVAHLRAWY